VGEGMRVLKVSCRSRASDECLGIRLGIRY
jgi:hypothetical protein